MDAPGLIPVALPDIIHVVNSVQHGGAERVVLDLVSAQHGRLGACPGHLPAAARRTRSEFTARGIPVTVVNGAGHGVMRTAWHLAGQLRAAQPRVVHAHNVAPQIVVALGRKLRPWGDGATRMVYTEHGRLADDRPFILAMRRWLGRSYDAVVAVSDDARDQLLSLGIGRPERTRVIKNGVDLTRFSAVTPHHPDQPRRIISVGRLSPIKGPDVLLEALAIARSQIGRAELVLVGDGPMRASLEEQARRLGIADMVRFAGALQDVRSELRAADLFVLPSRSEGVSLALLEAMATGLPIVATAVGGTPEVTGPGKGGLLVPPESPAALAEAIVTMLQDRALAVREGHAARQCVEERFSLQVTVAAYAACYGLAPAA